MKTVAFLVLIVLSALAAACTQSPTSAPDRGARWDMEDDTTGTPSTQSDSTGTDTTNAVGGGHGMGSGG